VLPPLLQIVLGCASILPAYQEAREAALADPGPAPESWAPDAVIHLSAALIDDVVAAAITEHGTFQATVDAGLATLEPRLRVDRLKFVRGDRCDDCVGVEIALDGEVAWTTPVLSGSTPVTADGRLDAIFTVEPSADRWQVTVRPRRLRDLTVELGTMKASAAGLSSALREWIDASLLASVPAQPIASLGEGLPVRAVRVVPDARTLQIHVLTNVPEPGAVDVAEARPKDGWRLDIAASSLLALARAEAFRAGPVTHDVLPEPTSLVVTDDGFQLGLRLWRVRGKGWWRDYTIEGTAGVKRGRLELEPISVVEGDRSPGAALVDPIAALGEGVILKAIEGAVDTTVPLSVPNARLDRLEVDGAVLRAHGTYERRE
jgi:hypothetical protein